VKKQVCYAVLAMLLLLLAGRWVADYTAAAFSGPVLLGERNGLRVYTGAQVIGEMIHYSRETLLEGLLLRIGRESPIPQDMPVQQARNVRKLIGLYVPAAQSVSLSEVTIYALCALCDENQLLRTWIVSGARSPAEQNALQNEAFERYRTMYGVAEALQLAQMEAPTHGTSEHQLAACFDVQLNGALEWAYSDPLDRNTDGRWLRQNAWRFGFIRRYPPEKAHLTGVTGEEMHFRFVGKTHAAIMYTMDWCLEEYLEALHLHGGLTLEAEDGRTAYILCSEMTAEGAAFCLPSGYCAEVSTDNLGYAVCALTRDYSSSLDR